MLWNDAVFRSVNESRAIAPVGVSSAARNGLIGRFIDQSYVATQVLAIRRLTEAAARKSERQIISLQRLIDDMRKRRHLITRENYVSYDGLPYDYEVLERSFVERIISKGSSAVHVEARPTTGPEAFGVSRMVHEAFDKISGVRPEKRSRKDTIRVEVFDMLDEIIVASGHERIVGYGNKFIAHAADAHSRATLAPGDRGLTLDKLAQCHRKLVEVSQLISGQVLWEGEHGAIPIPQFDQFEHLTSPWIPEAKIGDLRAFWERHVEEVESWKPRQIDLKGAA